MFVSIRTERSRSRRLSAHWVWARTVSYTHLDVYKRQAYSHTASIALQAAGIITMRECLMLQLSCDYGQYGRVASLVPECGGVTDDTLFEEKVTVSFHMAPELLGAFQKKLADATNGQVTAEETGKKYFEFEE